MRNYSSLILGVLFQPNKSQSLPLCLVFFQVINLKFLNEKEVSYIKADLFCLSAPLDIQKSRS